MLVFADGRARPSGRASAGAALRRNEPFAGSHQTILVPTGQLEISQTRSVWCIAPTESVLTGRWNPSSFQDEQTSPINYQPLRSWLISIVALRQFAIPQLLAEGHHALRRAGLCRRPGQTFRSGICRRCAPARRAICPRPPFANPERIEIIQPKVGPSRMGEELPWVNRSEYFPTLKGLHRLAHELIQPFQGCGRLVSSPGVDPCRTGHQRINAGLID